MPETTTIRLHDKGTFVHYYRGQRISVDARVVRVLTQKCFKISYVHPKFPGRVEICLLQTTGERARFTKDEVKE